jgi:hypothetical protein
MASSFSPGHATAVLVDDEQDIVGYATCPMCHTPATVSLSAVDAGADWRCVRCGQHWDSRRLATVAAYAAWTVDHGRAGTQGTDHRPQRALVGSLPIARRGGRP